MSFCGSNLAEVGLSLAKSGYPLQSRVRPRTGHLLSETSSKSYFQPEQSQEQSSLMFDNPKVLKPLCLFWGQSSMKSGFPSQSGVIPRTGHLLSATYSISYFRPEQSQDKSSLMFDNTKVLKLYVHFWVIPRTRRVIPRKVGFFSHRSLTFGDFFHFLLSTGAKQR